jgi:hypothetical protein
MSTIEELKKLQNYNINNAKPLTVRGQYSNNINTNINKVIQSVSLLTTELNNINSSVKESSFNTNARFSMEQWIDEAKDNLISQLFPSIQTLTGDQNPITKKIVLTNNVVTSITQAALNQQDILLNQLEDQVLKIVEKQNVVKVEKDENGNITLVPIIQEQAQKSLGNVTKILKSSITTLDKINTRISNDLPLKNINDFVNNLSLKHVIEFAEKIIAVVTLTLEIRITLRKIKEIAASVSTSATGNVPLSTLIVENSLKYTAEEQRIIKDLSEAQVVISIIKSQIQFYQNIIQDILNKLKEILDLIKLTNISQSSNLLNQDIQILENNINTIIDKNQQTLDTNKEIIENVLRGEYHF